MEISLDYSEMCSLLATAGANAPAAVDADHFPPVSVAEMEQLSQAGQAASDEQKDRAALAQTLARPTAVIHATRIEPQKPDEHIWFFYAPGQMVRMHKTDAEQYSLTALVEESAVLDQIMQFLPLQSVHPDLNYRITVDEEEFENLRDLAIGWEQVPSLATLEADGLDSIGAQDLFDSAVAPEWRGIVHFSRLDGQDVDVKHTVRALQGQEAAWLIHPYPADSRLILLETAQTGELRQALENSWRTVTAD